MEMTNLERTRADPFYKDIMNKIQEELKSYDADFFNSGPFDFDDLDV